MEKKSVLKPLLYACTCCVSQVYDSYQSLLNGLDLLVQVCHNFPSPAVRNENSKVTAVAEVSPNISVDTVDGKNVCSPRHQLPVNDR